MQESGQQDRSFARLRGFLRSDRAGGDNDVPSESRRSGGPGPGGAGANARAPGEARPGESFLRRVSEPGRDERSANYETCELCSVPLLEQHRHLLEAGSRRVVCSCDPCALRFHDVLDGRYKLIPRDARALPDFEMTDLQWAAFSIPINLAFLFRDSADDRHVALYPSPAGVTEAEVPIEAWSTVAEANPVLDELQDDVEALLVNRLGDEPLTFIAPIDKCYELSGMIRVHWRGFSGGEEVWQHVDEFFDRMSRYAR